MVKLATPYNTKINQRLKQYKKTTRQIKNSKDGRTNIAEKHMHKVI